MKRFCAILAVVLAAIALTEAAPRERFQPPVQSVAGDLNVTGNIRSAAITDGVATMSLGQLQPAKDGALIVLDAYIFNPTIQPHVLKASHNGTIPNKPGWVKLGKPGGSQVVALDPPFGMDGAEITIYTDGAYPNAVRFQSGGLIDGGEAKYMAVLDAQRGNHITIYADGGEWILKTSKGATTY